MKKSLFIRQIFCAEKTLCHVCRDKNDDMYRRGWASMYVMPPDWPNCPFGIPWDLKTPPPPVPAHLLGIMYDQFGTPEALDIKRRIEERADYYRPTCLDCPGKFFTGITEDGNQVACDRASRCGCAAGAEPGFVHLGVNTCLMGYWNNAASLQRRNSDNSSVSDLQAPVPKTS